MKYHVITVAMMAALALFSYLTWLTSGLTFLVAGAVLLYIGFYGMVSTWNEGGD